MCLLTYKKAVCPEAEIRPPDGQNERVELSPPPSISGAKFWFTELVTSLSSAQYDFVVSSLISSGT